MSQIRYHSLDAARGLLMMLGVYFHIIVFHYEGSWLGLLGWGSHYFRMHTFFLISGFFSALVLNRKGHYEMLHNRFKRIFMPLIIFAWPIWILLTFSTKFNELRYENGILASLKESLFQYISQPWTLIPWETMHLWFLSLLFGMSLFSYILRNRFSNNLFFKQTKVGIRLIFDILSHKKREILITNTKQNLTSYSKKLPLNLSQKSVELLIYSETSFPL